VTQAKPMGLVTIQGSRQGLFKGDGPNAKQQGLGRIVLLDFAYELSRPHNPSSGQTTGKRKHSPFTVTKLVGPSSPMVFSALVTNEVLSSIVIELAGGGPTGIHYRIQLRDAVVAHIRQHTAARGRDDNVLEDVSFIFKDIEVESVPTGTLASDSSGPAGELALLGGEERFVQLEGESPEATYEVSWAGEEVEGPEAGRYEFDEVSWAGEQVEGLEAGLYELDEVSWPGEDAQPPEEGSYQLDEVPWAAEGAEESVGIGADSEWFPESEDQIHGDSCHLPVAPELMMQGFQRLWVEDLMLLYVDSFQPGERYSQDRFRWPKWWGYRDLYQGWERMYPRCWLRSNRKLLLRRLADLLSPVVRARKYEQMRWYSDFINRHLRGGTRALAQGDPMALQQLHDVLAKAMGPDARALHVDYVREALATVRRGFWDAGRRAKVTMFRNVIGDPDIEGVSRYQQGLRDGFVEAILSLHGGGDGFIRLEGTMRDPRARALRVDIQGAEVARTTWRSLSPMHQRALQTVSRRTLEDLLEREVLRAGSLL
jgi:type VI secretion system Hcp family effector